MPKYVDIKALLNLKEFNPYYEIEDSYFVFPYGSLKFYMVLAFVKNKHMREKNNINSCKIEWKKLKTKIKKG